MIRKKEVQYREQITELIYGDTRSNSVIEINNSNFLFSDYIGESIRLPTHKILFVITYSILNISI